MHEYATNPLPVEPLKPFVIFLLIVGGCLLFLNATDYFFGEWVTERFIYLIVLLKLIYRK